MKKNSDFQIVSARTQKNPAHKIVIIVHLYCKMTRHYELFSQRNIVMLEVCVFLEYP